MSARVLKNAAIYTIVTLLQRSIGLLLLPLYTFFLLPGDYGQLSVVLAVSNFVSIVMLLAIPYATARFNFKLTADPGGTRALWGNNLLLVLLSAACTGTLLLVFHPYLVAPFTKGIPFYPLLFTGIVTTMLNPVYLFYQSYLQTGQHGRRYGLNMLLNFSLNTGLIILFVAVFRLGVTGILLANLLTALVFAVYALLAFLPVVRPRLNREQTARTLRYSLPLVPHSLSLWALGMTDRMFLLNSRGAAETGIYSVGSQVGCTMNVITAAANQAWSPWFYDVIRDRNNMPMVIKMCNILCALYCLLALAISFFSREIIQLLAGERYAEAWKVIPLTAFACVLMGYYHFFANVILLEERTKYLMVISTCGAACSIVLNIFAVPAFGGMGAAVSMLLSYLLASLLALSVSRRLRKDIRFRYGGMYGMFGLAFAVSLIAYSGEGMPAIRFLILKALVLTAFITVFFLRYRHDIIVWAGRMKAKIIKVSG
ncbi:oligosaccharide flippase family protein [Chitinophaga sp. XS-30]|uniref:oligosaccharide flippase family protein n=1 Tax=Chitinophaga sp. XS-30 TaxID=2604421 RepID=UPI0011DDC968|nr:oligosaccharide flippase family protein [Chitinophaga sp. XS-30]QEH41862.1 oligosaccharide flippase family protein [Chitinophaga sp. XS-30]